jgi:hypothetical protein
MNDRALELFKQAGATAYEQCKKHDIKVESNDITWTAIMASTLAELIVKECVDLFPLTSRPLSGGAIQSMIKQHFGVSE